MYFNSFSLMTVSYMASVGFLLVMKYSHGLPLFLIKGLITGGLQATEKFGKSTELK